MPGYLRNDKFKRIEHPSDLSRYIPVLDWAKKHNYTRDGVYRKIRDNRVSAIKMRGRWYILDQPLPPRKPASTRSGL
jgi:hypothetical protein